MSWSLRSQATPPTAGVLIAAASGASAAALGGLVVAGWLTVAVTPIQVLPGFPPMQYNTALGFMICGAGLLTAALRLPRPTALLGSLAAVIGLATLCQYLFQADLGIDDLLVETYVLTGVSNPGRMAPNSAAALALVGAALLGLSCGSARHCKPLLAALLGTIVIALGTAVLVGYVAGVPGAYGWGNFNRMSAHTALGFMLLGGGIVGLAWNAAQAESEETPPWLPVLAAVGVGTVTLCMWYALGSGPSQPLSHQAADESPGATPDLANITLAAGLLTALLVGWSLKVEQTSRQRARSLAVSNLALSEQSHARQRAEETLHQLAAIVEHSNDAIIATTLDGTIQTWNAGAERLYGYVHSEVRGENISLLSRRHFEDDVFPRIGRGERIEQIETVNLTKDGRRIDVSIRVSPMLDRTGKVTGASIIARDITERRQLEQMQDDFVGTVSHELRTPLTAIKGFIELVVDGDAGPLSDAQREFLQIASRNTNQLASLINDLLDVNQIDAQRLEIRSELTDMTVILEDVVATFRSMAESKGLAFQVRIDRLPSLMGDGLRLIQVFSNLISNAIKYTPEGEIGIRARLAQGGIEVLVHDSGIGLTKDEQAQLFTKFFRARNPILTEAGGTGLGLVIAKAIVEKHGGTIEVASVPGEGSHFRVHLPLPAKL